MIVVVAITNFKRIDPKYAFIDCGKCIPFKIVLRKSPATVITWQLTCFEVFMTYPGTSQSPSVIQAVEHIQMVGTYQ